MFNLATWAWLLMWTVSVSQCRFHTGLGDSEPQDAAEDFMASMYRQYQSDRYSHPMADTVRTLLCQNDHSERRHEYDSDHLLKFNISRITSKERVNLAELRVFVYVGKRSPNVSRVVSIFCKSEEGFEHVTTKKIWARTNGWHSFDITDAMVRWLDQPHIGVKQLKVSIEHYDSSTAEEVVNDDHVASELERHKEPIVVVFSERKFTHRIVHVQPNDDDIEEVSDLLQHNPELLGRKDEEYDEGEDEDEVYEEIVEEEVKQIDETETEGKQPDVGVDNSLLSEVGTTTIRGKRSVFDNRIEGNTRRHPRSRRGKRDTNRTGRRVKHGENSTLRRKSGRNNQQRDRLREASIADLGRVPTRISSSLSARRASNRADKQLRNRKSRRGRNHCRRRPMYVNFSQIKWGKYIFAPKGYQAYECVGRCSFPLSDRSTPTKHAIIQTIIHDISPTAASRTCCVPTRLTPISLLYENNGVITYKYKYENMVVAECGCR